MAAMYVQRHSVGDCYFLCGVAYNASAVINAFNLAHITIAYDLLPMCVEKIDKISAFT